MVRQLGGFQVLRKHAPCLVWLGLLAVSGCVPFTSRHTSSGQHPEASAVSSSPLESRATTPAPHVLRPASVRVVGDAKLKELFALRPPSIVAESGQPALGQLERFPVGDTSHGEPLKLPALNKPLNPVTAEPASSGKSRQVQQTAAAAPSGRTPAVAAHAPLATGGTAVAIPPTPHAPAADAPIPPARSSAASSPAGESPAGDSSTVDTARAMMANPDFVTGRAVQLSTDSHGLTLKQIFTLVMALLLILLAACVLLLNIVRRDERRRDAHSRFQR